jgi:integrase
MANRVDAEKREARLRALGLKGKLPAVLNERVVEAVRTHPTGERFMLADGKVPGLALVVGPDGSASWLLQARSLAGNAIRHGLGSAVAVSLDDVRDEAQRVRAAIREGRDPVAEKRAARVEAKAADASTLEKYIQNTYGPYLVDSNHKAANASTARILADWKPLLQIPVAQITGEMLCKVLRDRKAQKDEDGDALLSPATLRRSWATFRPALVYARSVAKLIQRLPIEGTPEPLRGLREEPSKRYLGKDDPTETRRFLDALPDFNSDEPGGGEFMRVACALALNAGLRRSEVVQLTDEMVVLTPGRERLELPARICKGNKARMVPLNKPAIDAIDKWRGVRKTLKVESMDGALFAESVCNWRERLTAREWPELRCAAGLPDDVTFKTLRATFASLHVQQGTPIQIVQQWLGHYSVTLTERHYGFLKPDTGHDLARAFRVS